MGAQQIQRCALTEPVRQQYFQATGEDIVSHIEPGLVGDARTGQRPEPHDIRIVAETVTADGQADFTFAVVKTPMVVNATAQHVQQAIVLGQLLQLVRLAMSGQVARRRTQHATILRGDGQRHQAGIFRLAVTQGNVHRLAEQIGDAVAQQQAHGEFRVLALELVEPGQQQVSTKVRRCRQLQYATDLILTAGQQTPAFVEIAQRCPGVFKKAFTFGGQAQAAGRTGEQAGTELLLDAFQRGARHRRRHVHAPCRCGQASEVRRPDKQLQIIETQHQEHRLSKKY
ncbi:hypothetical protein D3C84_477340 [compost metagenome]